MIKTDIALTAPEGTYCRIALRSGLALKGIDVQAGVVDRDFTGGIGVILHNSQRSNPAFKVQQGDRIAQMIFEKIEENIKIQEVQELS